LTKKSNSDEIFISTVLVKIIFSGAFIINQYS